jgi:hypothetical protein
MVVAGQEGAEGVLWRFQPPRSTPLTATSGSWTGASGAGGPPTPGAGPEDAGEGKGGRGHKKKGAAKVPAKKQSRYPKRGTR